MANVSSSNSLGERVPKLRFPEFEGEWDSSSMGELGTFTKGAPLSKADITETGTPLILYGELYTTYGDIANTIVRKTDKNVKSECYSISGDVIIPTSGESPEEISTCTCVMQDGVILAGDLNIYRTNNVDGRFLSYEINHIRNREIAKIAQGKSIVHIKADELAKIVIRFPSKAEQSKIIELFSCLDRKIELQKKLIDSLKLYKRGLLSKLFPQKGKSVPQYRFAGFTDAWEQRKLGELCEVTMGQSPDGSTYSDEPSDYILVQGNADLKDGWVFPRIWTTQKTKTAQAGDLIMSVRAPAGAMGKTAYDVVLGRGVAGIKGNEFVYQTLVKFDSDGYWKKLAAGSTFESVNSDAVKGAILLVPQDVEEQEKIGQYFSHLDHLITLHQQKYSKMQSIKKFMLQNMFV